LIDGTLRIEVVFRFQGFDSSEGKVPLFSIECSFDVEYEIESGFQPSPEAIAVFKDGNAVFNCWPYAREFLQSITSRLGHQTPAIPLLRIVPKKADPKAKLMEATTAELPAGEGADG